MDAAIELRTQRERFESWKRMNEASPTDPTYALVRATNEQTLAIYLVGGLLAQMMSPHFIDKNTYSGDTP